MMNWRFRILLISVIAAAACRTHGPRDSAILRDFSKYGCNPRLVLVWTGPGTDSVPRARACNIATRALAFVGEGGARAIGVLPVDSARITRVSVGQFAVPYPDGEPMQYYWLSEFAVPGRTGSLSIRIDRVSGKLEAKIGEGLPPLQ
jgi:hypothetical protein